MQRLILMPGFLMALIVSTARADVPQLMNFQGILTDPAGIPLANDTNSVLLTIYDAPAGGSSKWSETQSVTTDAQGRFNVSLGAVSPIEDTVFNGASRYLGIKIGADPEMSPRTQIVSVGYANKVSKTPQTGYVTASGWAEGRQLYSTNSFTYGSGIYNDGTGTGYLEVPLYLPDGATLTQVNVYCYDTRASAEIFALTSRQTLSSSGGVALALAGSGIAFAGGSTTITLPLSEVIDNSTYAYYLELGLPATTSVRYMSYRATYTLEEPGALFSQGQNSPHTTATRPAIILPDDYRGSLRTQEE